MPKNEFEPTSRNEDQKPLSKGERYLENLRSFVFKKLPEYDVSIDQPKNPSGSWFVDIVRRDQSGEHIVVQWIKGLGFGVTKLSQDTLYGVGPNVPPMNLRQTKKKILQQAQ